VTNGTIFLPTRYVLVNVPYVIRRPRPLAWDGLGLVSGGMVFPGLSKLLNQEDALGAPCLDAVIPALRRRVVRWFVRNWGCFRVPLYTRGRPLGSAEFVQALEGSMRRRLAPQKGGLLNPAWTRGRAN
jgi:hypothetical protein